MVSDEQVAFIFLAYLLLPLLVLLFFWLVGLLWRKFFRRGAKEGEEAAEGE